MAKWVLTKRLVVVYDRWEGKLGELRRLSGHLDLFQVEHGVEVRGQRVDADSNTVEDFLKVFVYQFGARDLEDVELDVLLVGLVLVLLVQNQIIEVCMGERVS